MTDDLRYTLGALERSMHAVGRDLLGATVDPRIKGADEAGLEQGDQRAIGAEVFGRLYADPAKVEAAAATLAERIAEAVHKACDDAPEFETLRDQVARDPIAAYSAMTMVVEGIPADVAERAATQAEADDAEAKSEAEQAAEARERARAAAELRAAIGKVADAASENERYVRTVGAAIGFNDSVGGMPPGDSAKLRNLLKNEIFRKAMDALGRMRAAFRRLASQERHHGLGVPFDVELGGDLSLTTGSALAMLASDDEYGDHAMRALIDRRLPQYRLAKRSRRERGPFVVLLDRSGSMGVGDRWLDALSVSVASLQRATQQGRKVALVTFCTVPEPFAADFATPSGRLDAFARLVTLQTGGGTCIAPSLQRAGEIAVATLGARSDVLLISDGEDGSVKSKAQVEASMRGAGLHYIHVGTDRHNPVLAESAVAFHHARTLGDDSVVLAALTATDAE